MDRALNGKVALVAGATRGAGRGIAIELGAAGAVVYATGRSTRGRRSEYDRPETIEETADLVSAAGGEGIPVRVDHGEPDDVRELVRQIDGERARLDVLVNDMGGEHLLEFDKRLWEQPLEKGLRLLRAGVDTHLITSHFALPLLVRRPGGLVIEITDGTREAHDAHHLAEAGAFYDLAKVAAVRLAAKQAEEIGPLGATAVALTPGWLRSESMLANFGVTEQNWRDATTDHPHFCISESPRYVGRALAALAADPDVGRWNGGSLSSGELAKVYGFTDLDGSRPDAWRYVAEVERAGKSADATGYR